LTQKRPDAFAALLLGLLAIKGAALMGANCSTGGGGSGIEYDERELAKVGATTAARDANDAVLAAVVSRKW
jgi:hypothetical protein